MPNVLQRFRLVVLVCWVGIAAAAGSAADNPRELDIRVAAHKAWDNSPEQVQAILQSAAQELWRYFPERSLKPILVEAQGGPITLFERGPTGEYRVQLDTGENRWAQWVFQFSHEFGHILSNYDSVRHSNKWFEETICEVASLFVLSRLAETWSKEPVRASWRKFAPALRAYADARIAKARLPKGTTLAEWHPANAREWARTGYDRDRNTTVAVELLPLFLDKPEHWEAIGYLALAKKGHAGSFPEFLKAWQGHCPESRRSFVAALARKFGTDLEQVNLMPPND